MFITYYLHPNSVDPFGVEEINVRPVVGEIVTCNGVPYRVVKEIQFAFDIGPMAAIVPMNYRGDIPAPSPGELHRADIKTKGSEYADNLCKKSK